MAQTPPTPGPILLLPGQYQSQTSQSATIPIRQLGCTININYMNGLTQDESWTQNKIDTFEAAADIWRHTLASPVEIRINASLTSNAQGFLGSTNVRTEHNFTNAPIANINYPSPLADKLAGYDLGFGMPDITIVIASDDNLNSNYHASWNTSTTSGTIDSDEFSFVTMALHEIGHGLMGNSSAFVLFINNQHVGYFGNAFILDQFIRDCGTGEAPGDFDNWSTELADFFQRDPLCWGFNDNDEYDCFGTTQLPRIFAPEVALNNLQNQWNIGPHLEEDTYAQGSINSLMTPKLNWGESNFRISPLFLCMLMEMGWTLALPQEEGPGDSRVHIGYVDQDRKTTRHYESNSVLFIYPNPANHYLDI